MATSPPEFGQLDFETVLNWCLPAFPLVKNEHSLPAISVAVISVIANNLKRVGNVSWEEPIMTKLSKWNLLQGKETYDDLRLNLIIVGDAGSGKTGIMRGIANLNPYKSVFMQSTPQYDQMIGSAEGWREKDGWKYQTFPGQLASDLFIMDEALSVYIDKTPENKKIRELLRASLSRIGTNMVNKPQVRIPEQFQCNYYPEVTIVQGFPLCSVPISLIAEGDIRRSQVLCLNFPLSEKEKTKRFGSEGPGNGGKGAFGDYSLGKQYLTYLRKLKFNVWVPLSTEEYVKKAMDNLKDFTLHEMGAKSAWYFKIAYFDIESQVYRYATVMSAIRDSTREVLDISIEDVKAGWKYFAEAYANSLSWINVYTHGSFGGGNLKDVEAERVMIILEWLKTTKSWSKLESQVQVDELKGFMVKKEWFVSRDGTKRFYVKMKAEGYIRTGQQQHGGKHYVWIGPKGKEILNDVGIKSEW